MGHESHKPFYRGSCPAKSTNLSLLDYYWFWSVCLVELRKNPPNSLPELVNTVERYAASLNKDQITAAVNAIPPRAKVCIESDGGAFEYKLKSFKERLDIKSCILFLKRPLRLQLE